MEALPLSIWVQNPKGAQVFIPEAKVQTPLPPCHVIDRSRLRVDEQPNSPSVWTLVAPAGYGKTTAASQIAGHLCPNVSWLMLERADNEPHRFAACFQAAMRGQAAVSSQASRLGDVLREETERLSTPAVIVLDSLHVITNDRILEAITEWLSIPTPGVTVIITSRREINEIAAVRTRGDLAELRSADLALTADELGQLCEQAFEPGQISRRQVNQIHADTEGWPAVAYLQACELTAPDRPTADLPGQVSDYITHTVLGQLPPALQEFLAATCAADVLYPELCATLTGANSSLAALQQLVDAALITERAEAPGTFVGRPTITAHNRTALAMWEPDRHRDLFATAARWHSEQGHFASALNAATESGDVELGKQIMTQAGNRVVSAESLTAVERWAAAAGPDGASDQMVCLALAWAAAHRNNAVAMEMWLSRAEVLATAAEAPEVQAEGDALRCYCFHLDGSIDKLAESASGIRELLAAMRVSRQVPGATFRPPPATPLSAAAASYDGIAAFLSHDLARAQRRLRDAENHARQSQHQPTLFATLSYLAATEATVGNMTRALMYADEVKSRPALDQDHPAMADYARSIALLAADDVDGAQASIANAMRGFRTDVKPVERALFLIQQARCFHAQGRGDDAAAALATARVCGQSSSGTPIDQAVAAAQDELRFVAVSGPTPASAGVRELTDREHGLLQLLPKQFTRRELAEMLSISENTVKTHLTAISRKLGVSGRPAIVDRAVELGLLGTIEARGWR